jgi:biopolymer transport protein TolQ
MIFWPYTASRRRLTAHTKGHRSRVDRGSIAGENREQAGFQGAKLNGSLDYFELITHGGPVVTGVLVLLAGSSIASWTVIFRKIVHLRRARMQSVQFLETFWRSKRLDTIYAATDAMPLSPVAQVFRAGYVELSKVTQAKPAPGSGDEAAMQDQLGGFENVERSLARATNAELTQLEMQIPLLGTTASASPFVGLFGTVWGIMGAFRDIYAAGNANLATVARPISEALIATAVGLFAAIPALVAYNAFSSRIRVLENEMHNFSADFLNIIKRHIFKKAA